MAVANLDGRRRPVGDISVGHAVAVVHGADKLPGPFLLGPFTLALRRRGDAIAGLGRGSRALRKELLLLTPLRLWLTLGMTLVRGGLFLLRGRRLGLCRGRGRLRLLRHLCLRGLASMARFALAAAPAAPMPLRLPLAVGRGLLQFRLGLRRICRHACSSWHSAIRCAAFLGSAILLTDAKFICLPHVRCPKGTNSGRSTYIRTPGKLRGSGALHAICHASQ